MKRLPGPGRYLHFAARTAALDGMSIWSLARNRRNFLLGVDFREPLSHLVYRRFEGAGFHNGLVGVDAWNSEDFPLKGLDASW